MFKFDFHIFFEHLKILKCFFLSCDERLLFRRYGTVGEE